MSSERFSSIISVILFVVGVSLLGVSLWLARDSIDFLYGSVRTEGRVIDLVEKESHSSSHMELWYPVIEFTSQDNKRIRFESGIGSNPASYSKGQTINVIYKAADPQNARVDSMIAMWYTPGFLGSSGLMMVLAAIGISLSLMFRRRERTRLVAIGHVIVTEVYSIMPDTSMSIKGRHPYRILSRYHHLESGRTYVFESDPIWYNPEEFFSENKDLSVYVDPQDYSKYYIDISFLPKVEIKVEM